MSKASGLAVVPFARYLDAATVLGVRLQYLVGSNRERIAAEFPVVAAAYETPKGGIQAVGDVVTAMKAQSTYAALAVTYNGCLVGAAELVCQKLLGAGMYCDTPIADGPRVMFWFGAREIRHTAAPAPLLPLLLPLLAQEVRDRGLPGVPWALVGPTNLHATACLMDVDNGFGGFFAWHGISDYTRAGDGVRELRMLYRAEAWGTT